MHAFAVRLHNPNHVSGSSHSTKEGAAYRPPFYARKPPTIDAGVMRVSAFCTALHDDLFCDLSFRFLTLTVKRFFGLADLCGGPLVDCLFPPQVSLRQRPPSKYAGKRHLS